MRYGAVMISIGISAMVLGGAVQSQEKGPDMIAVKYDGLKQEVLKHRGKVLVVDFWAGY